MIIIITIIMIIEVRSGEETSGNPRAYTETSAQRCVRTIRLKYLRHCIEAKY